MWGTFGYELDPLRLTDEERETVKRQIADYHRFYRLIREGDLYRIRSPFENRYYAAWAIVAADKTECLFTMVCMTQHFCGMEFVRFKGLDPQKMYYCEADGETYSGAFLMRVGLNLSGKAVRDGESFTLYLRDCSGY